MLYGMPAQTIIQQMDKHQNDMTDKPDFSTLEFRMGPSKFLSEMIFRYGAPWLLSLCVLGVTGITLGILIDYRWLFAVLFIIFVIAPTLLVFIYYYFGLRREAYVNTVLHSITAQDHGLLFRLKFPANSDSPDDEPLVREEFFSYADMLPMRTGLKSVTIPLRTPAKGSLWIPRSAFDSDNDMATFLQFLDGKLM